MRSLALPLRSHARLRMTFSRVHTIFFNSEGYLGLGFLFNSDFLNTQEENRERVASPFVRACMLVKYRFRID